MVRGNKTLISEFHLLGLSEEPELQPVLFGLFLSMYLITVLGNLLIILAVSSDSHLHMPMYFFLSNLSFVDICLTSTTIPKMLVNIQTESKVITYAGCITQMYFFVLFAAWDHFLLTVMAYDRYVAICHPLHYTVIMNSWLCGLLVLVSWIISALNSLLHCLMLLRLSFRADLEIPHFFCEVKQMIQLSCSDNFLNDMVMYLATVLLGVGPLAGILYSYSKIVSSIRAIPSAQGKYKAFSTCASHLLVVSLFYGTVLGVNFSSAGTHSSQSIAVTSVMYTVVTPMLNPFIYSLRNKDIKGALKRVLGMAESFSLHHQPYREQSSLTHGNLPLRKPIQGSLRACHLHLMDSGNLTRVSEFLLLGLSEERELQPLLFGLFLSTYLITVLGNLLIILAVRSDSHLHTPMYFFLSNLSLVDICFTSTTVPKMLLNIQTQSKAITYAGCITQMYFLTLFAVWDHFLLTVMAYDRYVAICHPLHYTVIMNSWLCGLLVLVLWIISVLNSLLQGLMLLRLSFCPDLKIPHFFCGPKQMTQLACSDNFLNDMVVYLATGLLGIGPLAGILYSYSKIVSSIRAIPSAQGKYKAFSTCASHLLVVSLFYGTVLGVNFSSAGTHSSQSIAVTSVMYTVVTPMLNPFIYSLRNKDIKGALKRVLGMAVVPPSLAVPKCGTAHSASHCLTHSTSLVTSLLHLAVGLCHS
ncbi:uncharacterized protein AAES06_023108 [Glossophaga mutica]